MLIMTTSCDAGLRVDLSCDSCDAQFSPGAAIPPVPAAIWEAALACGWSGGPRGARVIQHFCPSCGRILRAGGVTARPASGTTEAAVPARRPAPVDRPTLASI